MVLACTVKIYITITCHCFATMVSILNTQTELSKLMSAMYLDMLKKKCENW